MCVLRIPSFIVEVQPRSEIAVRPVTVRRRILGSIIVGAVRFHVQLPEERERANGRRTAEDDADEGE